MTWTEERISAFLKQHIGELQKDGAPLESICVVARTKHLLEGYITQLQAVGFCTYEIKRNAAEQRDKPGIRLATMHRVKGLEFEHVVVVAEDAVAKRNPETGEHSLLYVEPVPFEGIFAPKPITE
jgi:superfamily I DNA/RNA helicase